AGVGLSITCPTSFDPLEFTDSIEVEVDTDPLLFDFDLSPPSLFYPQLHNLFMKPNSGMSDPPSLNLDEKSTELKPSAKYFIKTMKPKRRPAPPEDSYQCERPFSNDITNTECSTSKQTRKLFYCRSCGKSFKFQTSLLRHNNKVHISKYTCPTCHRVFSRQAYLDVHTSKLGSTCYLGPGQLNKTK
ncbi:hypothetical protein WDU94_003731, partial [Cyamophila willieti]